MATFTEKDKTSLFVGKAVTITAGNDLSAVADGEIAIFNKTKTTRLAEGATDTSFTIVEGKTGTPFVSDTINVSDVTQVVRKSYQAAVEKVDHIGATGAGSSEAIEVINDNLYFIRLHIDQSITTSQGGGILVKHGQFKSAASGNTQKSIVQGLYDSLVNNFSREARPYIAFGRTNSGTVTASVSGNLTVKYGSKFITAATDIDQGGAVVGDYLSIYGVLYKIEAINGQTATVDVPYTGESGTVLDADAGFVVEATANAANWGIKLEGKPLKFSVGKMNYKKANWKTTLQNFGTSKVTETAGAYPGAGTYEQAAELEFFYKGNDGEYFRKGAPDIFDRPIATVPGTNYHTISFQVEQTGGVTTRNKRSKTYTLLIPAGANYAIDGTANDITDILEDLLAGKPLSNGNAADTVVDTDHLVVT